ncbi:MAG: DUF4332 domain-containing protein [Methanimicrococcus sp.]|nr:DUF4332 domain-containing protein [Methanimicrococcus sp.]
MVAITTVFTGTRLGFSLKGSGAITINWGESSDQKTETATLSLTNSTSLTHVYSKSGTYTIIITIPAKGTVTSLNCFDNSLTSLDVSNNSTLTELLCNNNKLASLNVSGLNKLQTLNCCNNNLNAQALDNLFKALNSATDIGPKNLYILNNPGVSGCTVKTATDKGWIVDSAPSIKSILGTVTTNIRSNITAVPTAPVLNNLAKTTTTAVTGVTLNKTALTIMAGVSETLIASVVPSTATNKNVTWSSDTPTTAKVDANGKVTIPATAKAGTAKITVTTADGAKTATCIVTVNVPSVDVTGVTLNKTALTLMVGGSETLTANVTPSTATNKSVTWKSDDSATAKVDANGKVTIPTTAKAGTTKITVTTADGSKTATCTVTVDVPVVAVTGVTLNKTALTLMVGGSETLTANVTPSTATDKKVTWKSDDSAIAKVSTGGKITVPTTAKAGTTKITVTTADGSKTATCTVTVDVPPVAVTGIKLNENALTIAPGGNVTLTAIIEPPDAADKKITWNSDTPSTAQVNSSGVVEVSSTAIPNSTIRITAYTSNKDISAECTITVGENTQQTKNLDNASITELNIFEENQDDAAKQESSESKKVTRGDTLPENEQKAQDDPNQKESSTPEIKKTLSNAKVIDNEKQAVSDNAKTVKSRTANAPDTAAVTGIKLNENALTIEPGSHDILSATVEPPDAADKKVTWSSSSPSDAQVNSSGVVEVSPTAVPGSTIQITAHTSNKDISAECTITVGESRQQTMSLKSMMGSLPIETNPSEEKQDAADQSESSTVRKMAALSNVKLVESEKPVLSDLIKKGGITADTTKISDTIIQRFDEIPPFNPNIVRLIGKYDPDPLLKIKWISPADRDKLNTLNVFDVPGLLTKGRTQAQRYTLAKDLGKDVSVVNSWVKQADLWRVDGMTPETACLLVQVGVRHVVDLAKVDAEIAYPIMQRLGELQSGLLSGLIDKTKFRNIIEKAGDLTGFSINQNKFDDSIIAKIQEKQNGVVTPDTKTPKSPEIANIQNRQIADTRILLKNSDIIARTLDIARILDGPIVDKMIKKPSEPQVIEQSNQIPHLSEDEIKSILVNSKYDFTLGIETNEPEPTFLFRNDIGIKSSGKIIREGLDFLNGIELALPLPHVISGTVFMRKQGEKDIDKICFTDASVEIDGITSPSSSKDDTLAKCSGFTDSEGKFYIIMPDTYNLQEGITLTISQGSFKQKFIRNASDIINSVKEQEILNCYDSLDAILKFIEIDNSKLAQIDWLKGELGDLASYPKDEQDAMKRELKTLEEQEKAINEEIQRQRDQYQEIKEQIFDFDKTSNDLEKILTNILESKKLEAEMGDFTLIEEIFKGYRTDLKRVLPNVKLMGNDDDAIHLPTDTAPSKVFNYSMLQRLVEPEIFPHVSTLQARQTMKRPIDVMNFKEQLYKDPDEYPQMASLGIGYVLNMHQAWCPDGFALGTLLYSLVLAPGEEQRLIVREKTQSYTVSDDSMGTDSVSEDYALSQIDDATASYQYALDQLSTGRSSYDYSTGAKTSGGGFGAGFGLGGIVSGVAGMFGLSGNYSKGTSKTTGHGSSSSRQSNKHNEASSTAERFQHSINMASSRLSASKRVSMRMATSEETDSVATKIIANHNHSHAMTIQYWEVLRRYRLETCIDSVDLVLFVPLKLIRFLPKGQDYALKPFDTFNKAQFYERYEVLLKYADTLSYALPFSYRTGLNLIKKYAAYPEWKFQTSEAGQRTLTLEFNCTLMPFDDVTASLVLKNGKGTIAGDAKCHDLLSLKTTNTTTVELKQDIRKKRNHIDVLAVVICNFTIPAGITDADLSYIKITHSCEQLEYKLSQASVTEDDKKNLENMDHKMKDLAKDNDKSDTDRKLIDYYKSKVPECLLTPIVTLSPQEILAEGAPTISDMDLYFGSATNDPKIKAARRLGAMLSSSTIRSSVTISIVSDVPVLLRSELQQMESLMHYVASKALHFSQRIWASLSADERAMLLEQYTINMDFDSLKAEDAETGNINIPLLNCVNVKKLLGFYGNCILLPFTYPQKLAEKLGKTAAEIQDSLYRYHTCYFRVPTTAISLPTDGMIGEAVLGETNVSELIDITRFWNWKDSPIDKMTLDSSYLNSEDYLSGKTPSEITALNLQGVTPPVAEKMIDLISSLVAKQTPTFDNITGLDQLQSVLNEGTKSAAEGRKELLDHNVALSQQALEYAKSALGAVTTLETKEKENALAETKQKDDKELAAAKLANDLALKALELQITADKLEIEQLKSGSTGKSNTSNKTDDTSNKTDDKAQ